MSSTDDQQMREMNEALLVSSVRQHELTERAQQGEAAAHTSARELASELIATRSLHRLSMQMAASDNADSLYERIVETAVIIMHSDCGSMHVVDEDQDALRLLAFQGFPPDFAKVFGLNRSESKSVCSMSKRLGRRVVVPDVETCEFIAGTRALADNRRMGIRAVQSTPLVTRNGRLLGVISTHWHTPHTPAESDLLQLDLLARQAADLIEHMQSQQALRESEDRYRTLFDLGPVAVYSCDQTGVIQQFNRRASELWGRSPAPGDTDEKFCGSHKLFRMDGSFMPHEQCPMAQVVSGQLAGVHDQEVLIERPDDTRLTVVVNIRPLLNKRGEITGAINCFYDITERKQIELAVEAANRAKDRFLATLSHELRTPLTPVMMSVAAMDMNPRLAPELREDIAMIRRNLEMEARLIDDLLDLSRVNAGKLVLDLKSVDVCQAVRQACETCEQFVREKAIHLHIELHDSPCHVRADATRLQQILWNLLRNAAKFTPQGGDIYVSVTGGEGDRTQIQVRDSGIGIPPEIMPRIFDAFEQGDANITRKFGGLGLGLAISKILVELHHGTIRAESAGADKGSIFTVELPAVPEKQNTQAGPVHRETPHNGGPVRILLVEDHSDTATVLSKVLRLSGYDVKVAPNAAAALALVETDSFDVIVSDIGLPDATGYDLMREIRAHHPLKGIAMSGFGMESDQMRSHEAGFALHLTKPITPQKLQQAIESVV